VDNIDLTSSIAIGESDMGRSRFLSLQAAMMDNGDAHRLERQVGRRSCVLAQTRFFK
jgi:hypothetical protein